MIQDLLIRNFGVRSKTEDELLRKLSTQIKELDIKETNENGRIITVFKFALRSIGEKPEEEIDSLNSINQVLLFNRIFTLKNNPKVEIENALYRITCSVFPDYGRTLNINKENKLGTLAMTGVGKDGPMNITEQQALKAYEFEMKKSKEIQGS